MHNDPKWEQPQQPSTHYESQQQWDQPQPQAWEQQPPVYSQLQWQQAPNQYPPQPYAPGQYNQYSNVPPYAQPQLQQQQTDNFIMRFLMMGIAVRVVLLILVPLLLCGGCAMVLFFASLANH